MQFTTAAITAILSASAVFAAPASVATTTAAPAATTTPAAIPDWTFQDVRRICDEPDDTCTWFFQLNQNTGSFIAGCTFVVKGSPASQGSTTTPAKCSRFSVSAGWSGQFGPGNGFTTLAVHDDSNGQMAWPAYTDAELADGKTVTPDKSFPVTQM
ncbi:hypothetical protein F4861DRAFT_542690 [Xylaria intraflava]|nr:hypothetical protein F4861DRAFT_542690 [Xylaria intraflava]